MEYLNSQNEFTAIRFARFSSHGVTEIHAMATAKTRAGFEQELHQVLEGVALFCQAHEISLPDAAFARFFLSDIANQVDCLNLIRTHPVGENKKLAISVIQEPPLSGHKVAAWFYFIQDDVGPGTRNRQLFWLTNQTDSGSSKAGEQTTAIFSEINEELEQQGMNLKDNCLRTWVFVRDIDNNYLDVVKARRCFFEQHGMTKSSHYIASTGIAGSHFETEAMVMVDALCIRDADQEQVRYLKAEDMLNPTHEYGVTFERGTRIDWADRSHLYISGTASINCKGEVVHPGDIMGQLKRTLENIEALLLAGESGFTDVAQMLVYIRDLADKKVVEDYLDTHFESLPRLLLLAPICRPGWLIEIECLAIRGLDRKGLKNF